MAEVFELSQRKAPRPFRGAAVDAELISFAAAHALYWAKCLVVVVNRSRVRRNPSVTHLAGIRLAVCHTTITTVCSYLLRSYLRFRSLDRVRIVRLVAVTDVIANLLELSELRTHLRTCNGLVRLSEHSNRSSKGSGNNNGLNKGLHGTYLQILSCLATNTLFVTMTPV